MIYDDFKSIFVIKIVYVLSGKFRPVCFKISHNIINIFIEILVFLYLNDR